MRALSPRAVLVGILGVPLTIRFWLLERQFEDATTSLALAATVLGPLAAMFWFMRRSARVRADYLGTDALLRTVLDTIPVGVAVCDARGRLVYVNDHDVQLHGVGDTADLPQERWSAAFHVHHLDGTAVPTEELPLVRVLAGEERVESFRYLVRRDGAEDRTVQASAVRVRDRAGRDVGAVVASVDLTDLLARKRALDHARQSALAAQRELERRHAFTQAVLESVSTGLVVRDPRGEVVLRNAAARALGLGRSTPPPEMLAALRGCTVEGQQRSLVDLEGRRRDVVIGARPIQQDGRDLGALLAAHDVTDLLEARASATRAAELHQAVLAASPDFIFITELATGALQYASPGVQQILGRSPEQLLGMSPADLRGMVHPDDLPALLSVDASAMAAQQHRFRCRHVSGEYRWLSRRTSAFRHDADGTVTHVLGVARDVTEVVSAERQLQHAARHDSLTGLPNRALLLDRVADALELGRSTGGLAAVLYVDLDGFKRVNDTAGHAAGDAVLVEVGARLRRLVRGSDTVARIGGDEFVVLLEPHPRSSDAAAGSTADDQQAVLTLAQDVRLAVGRPVLHDGAEHTVTASIGIAFGAAGATDAEQLLHDGDVAMYLAKSSGKNRAEVFASHLRDDLQQRARTEGLLRSALHAAEAALPEPARSLGPRAAVRVPLQRTDADPLVAAYQPVVTSAGQVVGFEALARLRDGSGRPVPPSLFVPIAEDSGLVSSLGSVMLDKALGQLQAWRRRGDHHDATMAVNVSAHQVAQRSFAPLVHGLLERHRLAPADLLLELTESALMQATPAALASLRELHDSGVQVAIDDFGTGYSSLRYLAELPVDVVKVDAEFTRRLPTDPGAAAIVRAVIGLAADLDLGCIVEGVETERQRRLLPPDVLMQGFLFGRPAPAETEPEAAGEHCA